jgi:hypothetical protein
MGLCGAFFGSARNQRPSTGLPTSAIIGQITSTLVKVGQPLAIEGVCMCVCVKLASAMQSILPVWRGALEGRTALAPGYPVGHKVGQKSKHRVFSERFAPVCQLSNMAPWGYLCEICLTSAHFWLWANSSPWPKVFLQPVHGSLRGCGQCGLGGFFLAIDYGGHLGGQGQRNRNQNCRGEVHR